MTRRRLWSMAVVCIVVSLPSFTLAQTVCGDADQDGTVDFGDFATIVNYLSEGGPYPSASGDCDNRSGITISDAQTVIRYIFCGESPFDCVIQSSYGFSPSLADTVFLPFMAAIPDGLDTVRLPVVTSLAVDTRAFYIPCEVSETNGPGRFQLNRVDEVNDWGLGHGSEPSPNTAALVGFETCEHPDSIAGRHTFFNMVFTRSQPGLADIICVAVIRTPTLRIAVERGGDLYTPVVMYYEVPVPHPTVTASPSSLNMIAEAGYWTKTSYDVTFTSDGAQVSFDLGVSDDWIVIENPSPTGYTTPATITVKANASALILGDYQGQITVSNANPDDAEFVPSAIDVALSTTEPLIIPPGDLNCDGAVTLGDIMLLVDCLFISVHPVPACE